MATGDSPVVEEAEGRLETVAKLQALIRIPTVSYPDWSQVDTGAFDRLLDELRAQFPLLHDRLELTRIRSHGLLLHWRGTSSAKPVVLMAHLDVVPIAAAEWTREPFSGDIVSLDGKPAVWGRGTLDDKGCVTAICEAVERLLAEGFAPTQDVWLSFGCDEEVFGQAAQAAVEELSSRGIAPWFVLDEGGAIAYDVMAGVQAPVGVVGLTEKGATALELTVLGDGGHASTPAQNGPTVRLARALTRLDKAQMPARLTLPVAELFRRLAPQVSGAQRVIFSNSTRFAPIVARLLTRLGPEAAAMVRTTFAITMLEGSPAINVIAPKATAGVNARILPGDTVDDAVAHVKRAIGDDKVEVSVTMRGEASPISPMDDAFALIESTITEVFPEAIATPYTMMAATDSRFFTTICERVYRFAPFRMTKHQRETIHAANEHIYVDDWLIGIDWYRRLIERLPV